MRQRDYRMDNIRFALIFLVVFGHLLELFSGTSKALVYRFIYTFHMPVFIFITGYYARFKAQKIIASLLYPYVLFQTLYQAFNAFVLKGEATVAFSYTTPYWHLWYLLAALFYYILIPMIDREKTSEKAAVFLFSAALSLLSGYDSTIGYTMSLSRFFVFLPFFVAGYYAGHRGEGFTALCFTKQTKAILFASCALFLLLAERFILSHPEQFTNNVLYGSYGYGKAGHSWMHRGLLMAVGFAWVVFLFFTVSSRKIPVISVLGKNSLPVFLFHGAIIKLLGKHSVFSYTEGKNLLLSAAIAAGIVLLLGNPAVAWICKWVFTGHWLTALTEKRQKKGSAKTK